MPSVRYGLLREQQQRGGDRPIPGSVRNYACLCAVLVHLRVHLCSEDSIVLSVATSMYVLSRRAYLPRFEHAFAC